MEENRREVHKGRMLFWNFFDILLFGAYFLFFMILIDPWGTMSYYDGLNDTNMMFGLAFIIFPLIFLFICIIGLRLFFIKRNIKSKNHFRVLLVSVILFNPIFALLCPIRPPGYKSYTKGFHQRMQKQLDIEGLRTWIGDLDQEMFDGEYYDLLYQMNENVLPEPIPKEIKNLGEYVHYLVFYKENEKRCLRIEWGGAFGHWGVVIGPKEMDVPPSDFGEFGQYRLKLEDGVYVWHEL